MLTQIKGLHHVTSMAADAQGNNDLFTKLLGMRRVKKTVNFDAPEIYHLYYGDEPGFDRDEDPAHLGEALKLPDQHAHLRTRLERALPALVD